MSTRRPALIIHGGCGTYELSDPVELEHRRDQEKGLAAVIETCWGLLNGGMSALDVVERATSMLEEDPSFNAGIGAAIGSDKQIELDASIMDGRTLDCGAVSGLLNMPNAVAVARRVMERTKHVYLSGPGANQFARAEGFAPLPAEKFYTPYQLYWWEKLAADVPDASAKGTVGAVAVDLKGDVAAATSTGGMTRKLPGRVGDSPIIGAGTYASNRLGGASATGWGEQIMKVVLCKTALDLLEYSRLGAQEACEAAIGRLGELKNGLGGIILIDANGNVGAAANERYLPRAYMSAGAAAPRVEFDLG